MGHSTQACSVALSLILLASHLAYGQSAAVATDPISGLALGPNYQVVRAHCTACHSAKLVTQNRMTRENWLSTIRWMQKSQGLWPLGDQEANILDYLANYYSPIAVSRRPALPKHLMPKTRL
jgi:cytochrome c1